MVEFPHFLNPTKNHYYFRQHTFLAKGTDELAFGRVISDVRQERRFARKRLRAETARAFFAVQLNVRLRSSESETN